MGSGPLPPLATAIFTSSNTPGLVAPAPGFQEALSTQLEAGGYDPYKLWPPGTEIYPPYETGSRLNMVFPPGYPEDLRNRLKALYNDPETDQEAFTEMYYVTFFPSEMKLGDTSGMRPRWTASWRGYLALTLKGGEAFLGGVDPAYREAAREGHRLAARLLWDDPQALALLPAYLRPSQPLPTLAATARFADPPTLAVLDARNALEGAMLQRLGGNAPGKVRTTLRELWFGLQWEDRGKGREISEGVVSTGEDSEPWWAHSSVAPEGPGEA